MSGRKDLRVKNLNKRMFQSPDGDSLCPDEADLGGSGRQVSGRFSPLTGILYVRTYRTFRWYQCVSCCFSPLTGILYVRTYRCASTTGQERSCFSPLTGILYVRTQEG